MTVIKRLINLFAKPQTSQLSQIHIDIDSIIANATPLRYFVLVMDFNNHNHTVNGYYTDELIEQKGEGIIIDFATHQFTAFDELGIAKWHKIKGGNNEQ